MRQKIRILQGNIVEMDVDAIVNAANHGLLGGGGVDGAIHRAAGPELRKECETLGGCQTGDAKITKGYNLKARHVIHTVGPIYRGGVFGESRQLERCYTRCFEVAAENDLKTLAFPSISTGAYGYPKEEAAEIVLRTTQRQLGRFPSIEKVFFVLHSDDQLNLYESVSNRL